jgi:hypothetical protein
VAAEVGLAGQGGSAEAARVCAQQALEPRAGRTRDPYCGGDDDDTLTINGDAPERL